MSLSKLELIRYETSSQGTFGKMGSWFTGELPWRYNQSNISCIPVGSYRAVYSYSPHLKRFAYVLQNVPNREGIRIHSANFCGETPPYKKQLNGCISLGSSTGILDGQKGVFQSVVAIRQMEQLMERKGFILEIKEQYV